MLNKLKSIKYLIENEVNFSEWKEAMMYHKIKGIIKSKKILFTKDELNILIKEVENI